MKRLLAWILSLTMLISLGSTAWAASDSAGIFYDSGETDEANRYQYVTQDYRVGEENYLPYFVKLNTDGSEAEYYAVGGEAGTVLYDENGAPASLRLGSRLDTLDSLRYQYKAKKVNEQAWSCDSDEIQEGWAYQDAQGDDIYCVAAGEGDSGLPGFARILCEGVIYDTVSYEPVRGTHLLYTIGGQETEIADGVYEAACAFCGEKMQYQKDNPGGVTKRYTMTEAEASCSAV